MNNQINSTDQTIQAMTKGLEQLNEKLKGIVLEAEIMRVVGCIEEILYNKIEYYIPRNKDLNDIVNAIVHLNFDIRTKEAKREEAYKIIDSVKSLHDFNNLQLKEYMYHKIEEYIKWLATIKHDNYKAVDKFFNIGESI